MTDLKTSIIIDLVNRVTGPTRQISKAFADMHKSIKPALGEVDRRFSNLTRSVGGFATKAGLIAGAAGWAFKSQFIDTAAQFERFSAVLETVEGSSAKAKKSMAWVSDFAATTPYEMDGVMEAFVRLRSYGLDPMKGLLRDLGDTSAAMGKPLMQSVEAIADAITGEYERLKEFGITSQTKGSKTRFSYTDSNGKQQYKTVDKNNRAIIESTLRAIWNEKYSGAMDKQSRTWIGMMSNLSDQWTRFKVKVMEAGVFDWMKGKLSDLLRKVDEMAANGSLQRIADLWGHKIKGGMEQTLVIGKDLYKGLKEIAKIVDTVATALGGYDNLLKIVAGTIAANFVVQILSMIGALGKLAFVTIPAVNTAVTEMAASGAFAKLAGVLGIAGSYGLGIGVAGVAGYAVGTGLNKGMGAVSGWLTDGKYKGDGWMGDMIYDALNKDPASGGYSPTEPGPQASPQSAPSEMSGKLEVTVTDARVKVTNMSSQNLDMTVDTGRYMPSSSRFNAYR